MQYSHQKDRKKGNFPQKSLKPLHPSTFSRFPSFITHKKYTKKPLQNSHLLFPLTLKYSLQTHENTREKSQEKKKHPLIPPSSFTNSLIS